MVLDSYNNVRYVDAKSTYSYEAGYVLSGKDEVKMKEIAEKKNYFSKTDTLLLKGVAIIMMMYHHCFLDETRFEGHEIIPTPFSLETLMHTSNFCKLCVAIFVFLSAYGMTISLKKINTDMDLSAKEFTLYTKKRFFNLMHGWLFVFILCQIFTFLINRYQVKRYGNSVAEAIVYFLLDGLGVADLFGTPTLVATWWYMSFAIAIIIIFPLLILLYKKIGSMGMLLFAAIMPRIINIHYEPFEDWFLVIIFGIVFADYNLLVQMKEKKFTEKIILDKSIKLLLCFLLLQLGVFLREDCELGFFFEFRHGILCLLVIYAIYEFLPDIKYLNTMLIFAGKHSMNMFLTHTLIRHVYFNDFTYSFKYPVLIVAVLFGISLLLSILIEQMKKLIGYNHLVEYLRKRWF